jgi:nitroreductase
MEVDYEALLDLLRTRRSVRGFLSEPLGPEILDKLIDAARWAPSAGNRQAWRFLAVESPQTLARMGEAVAEAVQRLRGAVRADLRSMADRYLDNFLHFTSAPVVLVPIWRPGAAPSRAVGPAAARPSDGDEEGLASVAAAIQNLLLAAHALGVGACWMTGPLVAREALERLLNVPDGWRIAALIPLGKPAAAAAATAPARRDAARLLHRVG